MLPYKFVGHACSEKFKRKVQIAHLVQGAGVT